MLVADIDNHLAGVGLMSEQRSNDYKRWNKRGHEGYLSEFLRPQPIEPAQRQLMEGRYRPRCGCITRTPRRRLLHPHVWKMASRIKA